MSILTRLPLRKIQPTYSTTWTRQRVGPIRDPLAVLEIRGARFALSYLLSRQRFEGVVYGDGKMLPSPYLSSNARGERRWAAWPIVLLLQCTLFFFEKGL
jgi:hypothetical protein